MAAMALPTTIKAVHQPTPLSADLILVDTPLPQQMDPSDVLVKVHAASPCNGELWWARDYPSIIPSTKEPVPGPDMAGTVVKPAINGAGGFKAGDAVFARIDGPRPGAAREYTVARARELALIPKALSFVEAAAVPVTAMTAWQGLFQHGGLDSRGIKLSSNGDSGVNAEARKSNSSKRVLITGASGAVGGWAVQLASLAGTGSVVAYGSGDKADYMHRLGATEVVDYRKTSLRQWASTEGNEVDLVFDMVGGEPLLQAWYAVKQNGVLLSVAGSPPDSKPKGYEKELSKATWFLVEPLGSNLAEISKVLEAGLIQLQIDSVWDFADFAKAYDKLENGRPQGKIVIKVDEQAEQRPGDN
jgi:NADPH:quinone reductase-like Zn-dependent oxidoreductase